MALVNSKSIEDLIALQLAKWQELEPNININQDSMVYMDAVVMAELMYTLQQDIITMTNNAFLAYATGDELSNLGADRGIARNSAVKATGVLEFGRAAKAAANYTIPSGTKVATQPGGDGTYIAFKTTEEKTLYGIVSPPENLSGTEQTGGVLKAGTKYNYKVTAVDGNSVETSPSSIFSITLASGLDNKSIDLTWSASVRATKYKIYVSSGEEDVAYLDESTTPYYSDLQGVPTASGQEPPSSNSTGAVAVNVNAEAVALGASGNVSAATVTQLLERPTGIEYVTNPSGFSGGSDEEDDVAYRARIREELSTNTGKTTEAGMKNIARSVTGVGSASVYLPYPSGQRNEVWVYITSSEGGLPSDTLVAAVQSEFDDEDNHAPTVNITVKKPSVVPVNVVATVTEYDDNADEDVVKEDIETNLETYINSIEIGDKVRVKGVENAIHDTTGVKDFNVTTPSANIDLDEYEMAVKGVFTIT